MQSDRKAVLSPSDAASGDGDGGGPWRSARQTRPGRTDRPDRAEQKGVNLDAVLSK